MSATTRNIYGPTVGPMPQPRVKRVTCQQTPRREILLRLIKENAFLRNPIRGGGARLGDARS